MSHVFQDELDKILDQYLEGKLNTEEVRLLHNKLKQGNLDSFDEQEDTAEIFLPDDIRFPKTNEEKMSDQLFYSSSGKEFDLEETNYQKFKLLNGKYAPLIAIFFTIILVVPFLFMFMSLGKEQTLVFRHFTPPDILSTSRSFENANLENEWNSIVLKYRAGNFSSAIVSFEKMFDNPLPDVYIDHFYLGVCYIAINEPKIALNHLQTSLFLSKYSELTPSIQWYQALAYIQNGQPQEARKTLIELTTHPEFKDFQKAELLLSEL